MLVSDKQQMFLIGRGVSNEPICIIPSRGLLQNFLISFDKWFVICCRFLIFMRFSRCDFDLAAREQLVNLHSKFNDFDRSVGGVLRRPIYSDRKSTLLVVVVFFASSFFLATSRSFAKDYWLRARLRHRERYWQMKRNLFGPAITNIC